MTNLIIPIYYKTCSGYGRLILSHANFPNRLILFEKECYQVVDILQLDFYLGNAFKYIWRLGNKGNYFICHKQIDKDCTKAIWYLQQYILNITESGKIPEQRFITLLESIKTFLICKNKGIL